MFFNMNNLLFIGLNGYAGAGKDTVAKMLKTILSQNWENIDDVKKYSFSRYTNPTQSATYNAGKIDENCPVLCIAYADQLKEICSTMFGIPVERFYMNKSNAWVCINDKFQYTEIQPDKDHILTAEQFYYEISNLQEDRTKYWLSLREILVYVGTYVLQQTINKDIFVNIVRNKIKEEQAINPNLKYVIVTDNRFNHELNYMNESNAITISITRDSVTQLENVAEHDLDNVEDYDYIIDNSGSYDDLIKNVWNIVHDNIEFQNITETLYTREHINNYLRLISHKDDVDTYKLCVSNKINELYRTNGEITYINPVGGPQICVGTPIDGTKSAEHPNGLTPIKIEMDEVTGKFVIKMSNKQETE